MEERIGMSGSIRPAAGPDHSAGSAAAAVLPEQEEHVKGPKKAEQRGPDAPHPHANSDKARAKHRGGGRFPDTRQSLNTNEAEKRATEGSQFKPVPRNVVQPTCAEQRGAAAAKRGCVSGTGKGKKGETIVFVNIAVVVGF